MTLYMFNNQLIGSLLLKTIPLEMFYFSSFSSVYQVSKKVVRGSIIKYYDGAFSNVVINRTHNWWEMAPWILIMMYLYMKLC